jgi:hemolysin activation/secretion protein
VGQKYFLPLLAAGFSIAIGTSALAQALPGTVTPGAVERELKEKLPPPPKSESIRIPAPEGFGTPQGAEKFHFTLHAINIKGATAIPQGELQALYAPLIDKEISLAQVFETARKITDLYTNEGYALSFALVPAQEIDKAKGEVTIVVIEGYVADVQFSGDTAGIPPAVRAYGSQIAGEKPIRTATLERFLLLMNDTPGYSAKSVFTGIPNSPQGATRLTIELKYKPYELAASIDNRGSEAYGPYQGSVTARLNSLLGQGEQILVRGVHTLGDSSLAAGIGRVVAPIGDNGMTLSALVTYSDTHPGSPQLQALRFLSSGWTGSVQLNYPLYRGRTDSLWVWGGFGGMALRSDFLATPNSRDHIYTLTAGATWNHRGDASVSAADLTLTQGLDIFDATTTSSLLRSRIAGSGVFTKGELTLTRQQFLAQTSWGDIDAYLVLDGQVASRGLLSAQQCGYGGGSVGRAFDSNEIVGDHCLTGLAEIRLTPEFNARLPENIRTQFYVVMDGGKVWKSGLLSPRDPRTEDGASIGAGLRFNLGDHLNGSVEYDQPLGRPVALEGNRQGRVFFQIGITN